MPSKFNNPGGKKHSRFADLTTILAQSRTKLDSATYQTIQEIINRLSDFQDHITSIVAESAPNQFPQTPSEPPPPANLGLPLHAPTHSDGAADPIDIRNLAGYSNDPLTFLRGDRTFGVPPGGSGGGGGMNLDYLGNYVGGPVYNDGDIVLAADGILYMCVVDGTITPPEPWPGTGVAVNGTADATFWVVAPHSQLTNERALNTLGTGYVRSTVGEPSVVPTIPLTDTTGILPDARLTSNVALKNINNNFSAIQTLPPGSGVAGTNAIFYFNDPSSPVNQRVWRLINYSNGNMYMESLSDTGVSQQLFNFRNDGYFIATGFAGNGAFLTNLNASNLATGTVPVARLGTNTPTVDTYLRGDNTWQPTSGVIPAGLIMISYRPCPVGWARVTSWDGLFLRSGPVIGVSGGAATHSHGASGLTADSHNHGGTITTTGSTSTAGNHLHSFSGNVAGGTDQNKEGNMNVDAGSSGAMARGPHTHDFSVNFSGNTASTGDHSHTFSGNATIPNSGPVNVSGNVAAASSLPPFVDIFYCEKL
jgi:hypothetical protein